MKRKILSIIAIGAIIFSAGCSTTKVIEPSTENSSKEVKIDKINEDNLSKINGNNTDLTIVSSESIDNSNSEASKFLISAHFEYDKYDLSSVDIKSIENMSKYLLENKNIKILIEGHCDEFGSDEYNFALGLKRAKAVLNEFVANGIERKIFSLKSLGKLDPICNDSSKECFKQNRRATTIPISNI